MKRILMVATLLFATASSAFANDITPMKFGVQYLPKSIMDKPFVNFMFTIAAKDFPNMTFSQISAAIALENNAVVVPPQVIYTKPSSAGISGSEILNLSIQGDAATQVIGLMKSVKIVFLFNDGNQMAIDIGNLCATQPEGFMNLMGKSGCP